MRRLMISCAVVLVLVLQGGAAARTAVAESSTAPPISESARDYQTVRRVGLALTALAFLVAVARTTTSEQPHEQSRAKDLLIKSLIIFVVLAGDRLFAQGIAGWFQVPLDSLPEFWR